MHAHDPQFSRTLELVEHVHRLTADPGEGPWRARPVSGGFNDGFRSQNAAVRWLLVRAVDWRAEP